MRDSTTVGDIPIAGTQLVMVYANGNWPASPAEVAHRFPAARVVWVDVNGSDPHAQVLDVETGDATPAMAPIWTKNRLALHLPELPVVYVDRENITAVFNAMGANGLKIGEHFLTGISTLDGTQRVADMTGVAFVQDRGAKLTGGHWDESIVYIDSWMRPFAPPPPTVLRRIMLDVPSMPGVTVVTSTDAGKTWR